MQTSQHQLQQQLQQQRANAMQAAGRMTAGRHASFEMGQSSQGWGFGSGMSGMNQARPPMSGYPSMMQSYQQQQQQQQQDALDMSDFPALGGSGSNVAQNPTISSASYASTAGTGASGLNNASTPNGGLVQEFSIEDDFPALPGARVSSGSAAGRNAFGQQTLTSQLQHHHRTQQQVQQQQQQQQQHQQDGLSSFSPLGNPVTGSQLQMQQQLAGDILFQQRQSLAQQQMLQRQLMGHMGAGQGSSQLNGSSPQLSMNANSPADISKMAKSYAMKASNSPSLHSSTPATSQASGSKAVGSAAGAPGMTIPSTSPSGTGALSQAPGSQLQGQQGQGAGATQPPSQQQQPPMSDVDRFGLYGMLGVIRMTDQDMMTLALGSDLTTLGLSLNSPDPLYGSFVSPWFESPLPSGADIDFQVPSCYNVQPPPPAQAKMSSLLDETLFYIFYSMPRDVLQDAAAVELYNRHWRYHKELRLWLTKDQTSEHSKTQTFERGTYIFFDPSSWEKVKKDFIVMYDALEERRQPPPALANGGGGSGAAGANAMGSGVAGNDMPVGSSALATPTAMMNGFDGSSAPNMGLLGNLNAGPASAAQQQQLKQQAVNAAH